MCEQYLKCLNAIDTGLGDSIAPSYGKQGTCWRSSDAAATTCTRVCTDNLAAEAEKPGAPVECR